MRTIVFDVSSGLQPVDESSVPGTAAIISCFLQRTRDFLHEQAVGVEAAFTAIALASVCLVGKMTSAGRKGGWGFLASLAEDPSRFFECLERARRPPCLAFSQLREGHMQRLLGTGRAAWSELCYFLAVTFAACRYLFCVSVTILEPFLHFVQGVDISHPESEPFTWLLHM